MLAWALLIASVPLPGTSSVSVPLSPPSACRRCHGGFAGSAHDTWAGSAMGHAARDPVFLAALVIAERDAPGVGDLCLRCHAPEAWLEGRCAPSDGSRLTAEDSGVTCSACHRMEPNPWVRNGQYVVADESDLRGPYGDSAAPHRKVRSDWLSDARLCGTCHDLVNPLVRRRTLTGTLTPYGFPEQTTYSEWAASAFAREGRGCIDCHMTEEAGPIAMGAGARPDRSSHGLAGGNTFLLEAIDFLEPGLALSTELALGRARAVALLQTAATLEVEGPASLDRGARFEISVRVTNESGHKLPTGYPDGRRVWLELESETLGFHRGAFDPMSGEPIAPLALYHTVHGQAASGPGHHLALNDTVFFDNRIPPRGFVPTATTAPVGYVYPALGGALAHSDLRTFTATTPCDPMLGRVRVTARLWYQPMTKAHLSTLIAGAGLDPRGARLALAAGAVDPAPLRIAERVLDLPVRAASDCAPPDAGIWPDATTPDARASVADAGVADLGSAETPVGCDCAAMRGTSYGSASGLLVSLLACAALVRRSPSRSRSSGRPAATRSRRHRPPSSS